MKHLFAPFTKLVAVAACALTLGSCNRAEYATLPQTSSYHGVARVAAPVPVAAETSADTSEKTEAAPANLAGVPVAAVPAPSAAPAASPALAKATPAAAEAATVVPAAPRKLNLAQRLAVAKVTKQLRKAAALPQIKQKSSAAEVQRISGNLRTGLILVLVGVLIGLLPHLGLVGTIVALIGVVFIVLWLLDNL